MIKKYINYTLTEQKNLIYKIGLTRNGIGSSNKWNNNYSVYMTRKPPTKELQTNLNFTRGYRLFISQGTRTSKFPTKKILNLENS